MARKFVEYIGGGYWIHRDGRYLAFLKASGDGWYGGANEYIATSVPLHGPYRFKRTAKKKALAQLALIRSTEELEGITWTAPELPTTDCIYWDCFDE